MSREVSSRTNIDLWPPLTRLVRIETGLNRIPLAWGSIHQVDQRLLRMQTVLHTAAGPVERFNRAGDVLGRAVTKVTLTGEPRRHLFADAPPLARVQFCSEKARFRG